VVVALIDKCKFWSVMLLPSTITEKHSLEKLIYEYTVPFFANFMKTSNVFFILPLTLFYQKTLIYSWKNSRPLFLSSSCLRESILLCLQVHLCRYCRTYRKIEWERLQPQVSRPFSTNDLGGIYFPLSLIYLSDTKLLFLI
jgi:hypothetical protein